MSPLASNVVAAWGARGQRFIDGLPAIVAAVTRDWGLTVERTLPMSFHWVAAVRRADGTRAVLKLGPPGLVETAREVTALRHFDGAGAVRLLADDAERGALLLEWADPGTPASALPDEAATAVIATVLRGLHRPGPETGNLVATDPPAIDLPAIVDRDRADHRAHLARYPGDGPFPRRLVTRALGLLDDLATEPGPPSRVVLHGDLHHDNVLAARDGWLAIDPHGVVGDPLADVGAMLYNPDPARRDPALVALIAPRAEQLADHLAAPLDRIIAWGFLHAVLAEVWSAEGGDYAPSRALDTALALERRL